MQIRLAQEADLCNLLQLYTHLNDNPAPQIDGRVRAVWERIMRTDGHCILVGVEDGRIVSSCVLVIVPNLTHGQRPYALIENVVTDQGYRNRGCATAVLNRAKEMAGQAGCYKIMLMTGSKKEGILCFYERAGYNRIDKTAFVQWLD